MKIFYVEDDPQDARRVQQSLQQTFDAEVEIIRNESAFVANLERIAAEQPDLVIMDIMLRWADPSPDLKLEDIPPQVQAEGFFTAGIRCQERLQTRSATKDIPVILYSVLDPRNFEQHRVIPKELHLDNLIQEIHKRLEARKKKG